MDFLLDLVDRVEEILFIISLMEERGVLDERGISVSFLFI